MPNQSNASSLRLPVACRCWCILLLCFFLLSASAQKKATAALRGAASNQPAWITMMEDPNVNYYKAVANFNAYWKHRVKPLEEDELFETGGEKEKEEALRERKQGKLRNDGAAVKYAYDYKRFLHWKEEAASLVQPDGHIKNMDTRIEEWKQQQQQKKEQQLQQEQQLRIKKPQRDTTPHH